MMKTLHLLLVILVVSFSVSIISGQNGSGSGSYVPVICTSSLNSNITSIPYSGENCLGTDWQEFYLDESVYGSQPVFWSIDFRTDVTNLSFSFIILPEFNFRPLFPQQGIQFFPVTETFM
jgi:hypothetical protein